MHQVSVIGGSVVDESICSIARRLGNLLASKGYIIFNGGLGGVMECVSQGVQEAGGIVIGIKNILISVSTYCTIPDL